MVATRRQVQAEPDNEVIPEQDPDLILKKKPVRKTTAKAANPKSEAKTKSTRGKKVEFDPEPEVSEAELPVTRQKASRPKKASKDATSASAVETVSSAKPAKAPKAGSLRGKRGAAIIEEPTEEPTAEPVVDEPKPTRSSRTGSVRGRKAALVSKEAPEAEATEAVTSTKTPSVRGRKAKAAASIEAPTLPAPEGPKPLRQTRAAATKPQPLSPKKITQVSKPATRNTRNGSEKSATKAVTAKAPVKARSTRQRTVSDENADVPDFNGVRDDAEDEDVIVLSSTPKKKTFTRKQKTGDQDAESDASMSSRPTTPNDSPAHSLNTVDEEDETNEDNESIAEVEPSDKAESDGSEDELCGPKTPMRRSSPTTQARYQSSLQRTARKYEDEGRIQTPVRRFAILGSQRGTPQTQKPYCKPTAPTSDVRPMTVSRAAGRSYVFKDLRDGAPIPQKDYEQVAEHEMSFLPDEDIIPSDATPCPEEPIYLADPSESALSMQENTPAPETSMQEDHEDGFVDPAVVQKYSDDPDDTVIVHDIEENDVDAGEPGDSFHTEDTVLIDRRGHAELDDITMTDASESEAGSVIMHTDQAVVQLERTVPRKTTSHAAIFVNFDEHLTDARPTPEDHAAVLNEESTRAASTEDDDDAVLGAERETDEDGPVSHDISHRQTVNFNDFIDIAALSEPTAVLNLGEDHEQFPGADMSNESTEVMEWTSESHLNTDKVVEAVQAQKEFTFADEPTAAVVDLDDVEMSASPERAATAVGLFEMPEEPEVPHYALPTISFDARRKSLPAISHRTPVKTGTRPKTSDGESMPRIVNPFANVLWTGSRGSSNATTPVKSARPSSSHAASAATKFGTPTKPRKSTETAVTPVATPRERYPLLASHRNNEGHANTVVAPARFGTPAKKSPKRRETFHRGTTGPTITKSVESVASIPAASATATQKERYPSLRAAETSDGHAKTVAAPLRFQSPSAKSPKRRETFHKAATGQVQPQTGDSEVSTPVMKAEETPDATPNDRYPRLRPRNDYEQHAKTVAGPVRFQTPPKIPLKRPTTGVKSDSLRKATLVNNTAVPSYTPMKTPLKAPGMTPSQVPMTPHPAAPLRGIVALVEVFTLEGASASAPFVALLHRLGAKTTRSWNDRITHVIFKDGSPLTLQRVRLNNKEFEQSGAGWFMHCVNSRWVTDCDSEGGRMDESAEAYVVDVAEIPRGGKRRRKSMEPAALLNLGGNIVRDRKSSFGRNTSLSRSPWKSSSPAKKPEEAVPFTPEIDMIGKENSGDEYGSPATPAWISAPDQLVQQTAPMKRVRKLDLQAKDEAKNRRLTFWNGAA